MYTRDEDIFDTIGINLKHRASLNYAKGRYAIEEHSTVIAKSNAARAKRLQEKYKSAFIDILGGEVQRSPKGLKVVFHDGSEAKY